MKGWRLPAFIRAIGRNGQVYRLEAEVFGLSYCVLWKICDAGPLVSQTRRAGFKLSCYKVRIPEMVLYGHEP